jgi:hypothetical protein
MSAVFPDETIQPFDPELPFYRVEGFLRDSLYFQTHALLRLSPRRRAMLQGNRAHFSGATRSQCECN